MGVTLEERVAILEMQIRLLKGNRAYQDRVVLGDTGGNGHAVAPFSVPSPDALSGYANMADALRAVLGEEHPLDIPPTRNDAEKEGFGE